MEALILLLPLSLLILLGIVGIGFWAMRSKQYDRLDVDGDASLFNDELIEGPEKKKPSDDDSR